MCLCVLLCWKAGFKLTMLAVNIGILSRFIPKPGEVTEMENGLTLALSFEAMKGNKDTEVVLSYGV